MVRYVFRDGVVAFPGASKADPQVIGEELQRLTDSAAGELATDLVWQSARAPDSPLHGFFTWDRDQAALKCWRSEARAIVRSVRIVEEDDPDEEPRIAYFSVVGEENRSYRTFDDVSNSESLQEAVMRQAERDLEAWEQRYKQLRDICHLVQQARETLKERRARAARLRGREDSRPSV